MRLSLKRGAAVIAVIAALGAGTLASGPTASADEAAGRAALQAGNYEKAIAELKPLAEKGEAGSQYLLAETYFGGHGGTLMEGLKWMTAAAEQGYAQAQARLGLIYATGRGVATNNVEAYRWFSLAAKLADPQQQKNLKTVSETNRTVVAKRLSPQERAKVDAEVQSWKPGQSMEVETASAPAPTGKIGEVIPGIRIQLAAVKKPEEAQSEWSRLQKALGDNLNGLSLTVESVDLGAKGIFHRVQAGPFVDKAAAAAKCEAIKALKQDCLVVVRK
jgi:TPR repeat protein